MSQLDTTFDDVDADLDALLNQDEAMEDAPASQPPSKTVDAPAATTEAFKDTTLPEATDKAEAADAAAPAAAPKAHQVTADDTQEPAKPASGGPAKPAIGSKKRQLTVPSVTMPPGGKRPTLKVLQASTAPAKPATMSSIAPPTAAPSEPMSTTTAAAPAESEASSPAKPPKPASPAAAKPAEHSGAAAEKDEAAAAADVTCCLGELTEQLAGAASDAEEADEQGGEGEATSPKKAAAPAATAAPAAPAALARKKKALTVAPEPTAGASAAASSTPAAAKAIKPSKSEKEKKMKAAPKKAPAAAAGEAEDPVGKLPTAKSAYMLFADDKRTQVKADHPELSFGEVGRKLGELWKALNEEDRKAYNDRAGAEKARVAAEIAAMDQGLVAQLKAAKGSKKGKKDAKAAAAAEEAEQAPAAPAAKKEETSEKQTEKDAAKAEKKAEKAAAKKAEKDKAAWESGGKKMHHRQLFVPTRMQHPGADIAQINAIISQAWVALTAEERTQFSKQAAEEAEADKALKRAPKAAASEAGSSKAASRPGKRGRKAAASGDGQESSGEETAADNGEESDREDVDWGEHPAAGVFAHSTSSDGRQLLMVRRARCGLDDYGTVDARQVKRARIEGGAADLPVSPEMVEEYDQFVHRFWAAVRSRTSRNELDLEGLEEGSPLEMCYLLGKLQEPGQILDANDKECKGKDKKDFIIRCPGLKLSMVVQRLLDQERAQLQQVARKVQGCSSLEQAQEAVAGLVVE